MKEHPPTGGSMTAQHTQGPWRVLPEETDKDYIRVRGTALGRRYKVANVLIPTYGGMLPREIEETTANARLIAAAPDLPEACKAAQNVIGFGKEWDQIASAIAKAMAGVDPNGGAE